MSLASALNVLRPTLPYYLALTKYDLLHINKDSFEFRTHPKAPPIALEMAKAVFTMGASSGIESYVMSQMLSGGPKVFAFDALTCEALERRTLQAMPKGQVAPPSRAKLALFSCSVLLGRFFELERAKRLPGRTWMVS